MQLDFHYYATFCAAILAGFSRRDSLAIAYCDQFVDECSATLLSKIKGPAAAATTQLQSELLNARTDRSGLQNITRIWSSFHFLPYDLFAVVGRGGKRYKNKFRLICGPNGSLVADTVRLAKDRGPQAAGVAMHVLSDTWAHRYFAGTPSLVINNTDYHFYELTDDENDPEKPIRFNHNPLAADDPEKGSYTNSLFQTSEKSIMNLGHGRAGHFPDYSYARYRYLPAWGDYREVVKDNPSDYFNAFCQMIRALKYLRGDVPEFAVDTYDEDAVAPYADRIRRIIGERRTDASADWRALGEELSGGEIEDFDILKYQSEYRDSDAKADTFLGRFIAAALAQKSMVTDSIYRSGNPLAGFSVEPKKKKARRAGEEASGNE
ncbi:MAG: hypothetical protein IKG80_05000 [Clostridia bacterium]|nr:hypothetical protein [Clostridia bacterium]